jgi:FAD/FMN-containing dehydrogenase
MSAPANVADQSAVYLNLMGGAINAVPPDATPFVHRGYLANYVQDTHWTDLSITAAAETWATDLYAAMQPYRSDSVYCNYQDRDIVDWPSAYYGPANYARLQAVKAAYDRNNTFSFPQSIQLPQLRLSAQEGG